jgi:aspartate-semialdehyde dehydrogenase
MREYNVAIVGATGAVGEEMLAVLSERNLPIKELFLLASSRSAGQTVEFKDTKLKVIELTETVFEEKNIEVALFSAGGSISAKFAKFAVEAGAVVIDNTSHFRMQNDVPLVVPEVNPSQINNWQKTGVIANPNCSTIQMVTALKPLDDAFDIERVDVSTYQATSGAGKTAMKELGNQMKAFFDFNLSESPKEAFPHQIALNLIPQIDKFMDNDYTKEEIKMVNETQKILEKELQVSATCVRVPIFRGHSESVTVTFKNEVDIQKAKEVLANFDNIVIVDEPEKSEYPMPKDSFERDEVFVGRIRKDLYNSKILHLWVVADNLRVGAATNAVKIAEKWIKNQEK